MAHKVYGYAQQKRRTGLIKALRCRI